MNLRAVLWQCELRMGREKVNISNFLKLIDLFLSISQSSTQQYYYGYLYLLSAFGLVTHDDDKEVKKVEQKLVSILKQQELKNTQVYQYVLELQKQFKEEKKAQSKDSDQKEKMREIKQIKEKLSQIELYTYGKYTIYYLETLFELILQLFKWKDYLEVTQECKNYLKIRNSAPYTQNRILTCSVLKLLINFCGERRKNKEQFQWVCSQLALFMHSNIYSKQEQNLISACLFFCGKNEWWRAGKPVVQKIMTIKFRFSLNQDLFPFILMLSYVLLLLTISKEDVVKRFRDWVGGLPFTSKQIKDILAHNDDYEKSDKSFLHPRIKDYSDGKVIKTVRNLYTSSRKAEITSFPLSTSILPAACNNRGLEEMIESGLGRGETPLLLQCFHQYTQYRSMGATATEYYLRRLHSSSKLHLSEQSTKTIPSLLQFYSYEIKQLLLLQTKQMNMDLIRIISQARLLDEHQKQELKKELRRLREGKKEMERGAKDEKHIQEIQVLSTTSCLWSEKAETQTSAVQNKGRLVMLVLVKNAQ